MKMIFVHLNLYCSNIHELNALSILFFGKNLEIVMYLCKLNKISLCKNLE